VPDAATLLVFVTASAALVAVPGPAVVYIVTRSVAQGRRAGVASALGIEAGALVHVGAAAIGVSALVASSATAFTALKLAGAAYLVLLGVRRLRATGRAALAGAPPDGHRRLFGQGVVVNALNPKVAVFFVAFLPQFVDPAAPVAPQVLVLGAAFVGVATVLDCGWALTAGAAGTRLRRSSRLRRRLDRAGAGAYVALGVGAALARRPAG
jgi:threonine/homoserine/homoserine lactone efflux protein